MKNFNMARNSFIQGRLSGDKQNFPAKFVCTNKKLEIEVFIRFNRKVSMTRFDLKMEKHEFLIRSPKGKEKLRSINFIVRTVSQGQTKIGIAYKTIKISESESSKKLKCYKNKTAQMVLKYGINYSAIMDFKLDIDLSRIKSKTRNYLPKVEQNKNLALDPFMYNLKKLKQIKKSNLAVKMKTERARNRKMAIYERKMNSIHTQSQRNRRLKKQKVVDMRLEVERMRMTMIATVWAKIVMTLSALKRFRAMIEMYKVKQMREKKFKNISFIMAKFILPMRREKKTKLEGIFTSCKKYSSYIDLKK